MCLLSYCFVEFLKDTYFVLHCLTGYLEILVCSWRDEAKKKPVRLFYNVRESSLVEHILTLSLCKFLIMKWSIVCLEFGVLFLLKT